MELTIGGKLYLYTFACKFYFEVIIIIIIIYYGVKKLSILYSTN